MGKKVFQIYKRPDNRNLASYRLKYSYELNCINILGSEIDVQWNNVSQLYWLKHENNTEIGEYRYYDYEKI